MQVSTKSAVSAFSLFSLVVFTFLVWLIYVKDPSNSGGIDVSFLPWVNALCNTLCASCLAFGIVAIKKKKIDLHRRLMLSAFFFSAIFLVSYIIYHNLHGDTPFEGTGLVRPIYFFILITHIVLSAVMLPMILTTFYFALTNKIDSHRKLARYTAPVWLYVSVTGVAIVFFLKWLS